MSFVIRPFVEVHHIIPQSDNGPDTLDNAAPLCAGCHSDYGGNPDKRKQIKEMRDFWYDLCATRYTNSPLFQLNQSIDEIKKHTTGTKRIVERRKSVIFLKVIFNNRFRLKSQTLRHPNSSPSQVALRLYQTTWTADSWC